jgi:hypothetical protein
MFQFLLGGCLGIVAAFFTQRYFESTKSTGHVIQISRGAEYMKISYSYQGKDYVTYAPYDAIMAAQGWRVIMPDGKPYPFHPGVIPSIPVAAMGVDKVTVRQGVKKSYTTDVLFGTPMVPA